MKESNLWLSPEELQHMLKGSLQWPDVALRLDEPRNGFRKLGSPVQSKETLHQQVEPERVVGPLQGRNWQFKVLEGQPLIWLLGSVGFLTLSTWFYFLLF